jgi:hypothetical protein
VDAPLPGAVVGVGHHAEAVLHAVGQTVHLSIGLSRCAGTGRLCCIRLENSVSGQLKDTRRGAQWRITASKSVPGALIFFPFGLEPSDLSERFDALPTPPLSENKSKHRNE